MNATITFWIIAAAFVAVCLAFLLPPLLRRKEGTVRAGRRGINIAVYRDQMKEMETDHRNGLLDDEQFAAAKLELEARLAQDAIDAGEDVAPVRRGGRVLGYSLAGIVPAAAFGLYMALGNPAAIDAVAAPQTVPGDHDIMKMVRQVEAKTRSEPNNPLNWAMLGKTAAAIGNWPKAVEAYEKAYKLKPDVPQVMTGYAEALAISKDHNLRGQPMELVTKALELDPDDLKGLELAGIYNFQEKNFAQAAYYLKRLLKQIPPESPYGQDIAAALQEVTRLLDEKKTGGLDNLSNPGRVKKAAPGAAISGQVELAAALKTKVAATDTVFLFARPEGGGAPAAALRAQAGSFPLKFELSDAMAMDPANRLSNFKEVTLIARVAKSGDVKGAAGDLEGSLAKVKVGASGVKLVIDKVRDK